MTTIYRVNLHEEADRVSLEVLSAPATETEGSYRIEKGALALATQTVPKGKAESWGISSSRAEAIRLARQKAERERDAANADYAAAQRRVFAILDLEMEEA